MKRFIFSLIFCSATLCAEQSLASHEDHFVHARRYFHNSELQRLWTASLLRDLHLVPSAFVLDYGCRDGKIAADLSFRVPYGHVVGADSQEEFLVWAMRKYPRVNFANLSFSWTHEYINNEEVLPIFDLIVSVNRLHREPDPALTLHKLYELTQPAGQLYVTIPGGHLSETFQVAFAEVRDEYNLATAPNETGIREVRKLKSLVEECGYQVLRADEVFASERFVDVNELHGWVLASLAPGWNLPEHLAAEICTKGIQRYLEKKPDARRSDGTIIVPMRRIELRAVKLARLN